MGNGGGFRRINGWKALALVLTLILVFLAAAAGGVELKWRADSHLMLRKTRNVWTALRITEVQYYGKGASMYDTRRRSGLKADAEQQVQDLVGYEGEIAILSHGGENDLPTAIIYHETPYTVYFYVNEEENREFKVYRGRKMLDLDSGAQENF